MAKGNITVTVNVSKTQMIVDLKNSRDEHAGKVAEINKLLTGLCVIYGHDDRDDGHDSHYSYIKCFCCGRTEKT
jgi:hypothetical protein